MQLFDFGEHVNGYEVKVINERVARAGAGILFAIGLITFMNSFLTHDFTFAKVFISFFMFDFFMRIFVNPKFSPSLILGYFFVRKQIPEYVGANQKRFAWAIGFILALVMFVIVVILEIMTPIKIAICMICLVLLFSESAFGICLGCKIYHILQKDTMYCAGGCDISNLEQVSFVQWFVVFISMISIFFGFKYLDAIKNIASSRHYEMTNVKYVIPYEHHVKDIQEENSMNDEHMNHGM